MTGAELAVERVAVFIYFTYIKINLLVSHNIIIKQRLFIRKFVI